MSVLVSENQLWEGCQEMAVSGYPLRFIVKKDLKNNFADDQKN